MQEMARAIMVQALTMSANVPVGDVGHRQNIWGARGRFVRRLSTGCRSSARVRIVGRSTISSWGSFWALRATLISNKVASEGVPMDVGRVGWHDDHDHDHDDYEKSAIGQHTQCHNCGGWGHISRECPSERFRQGRAKISARAAEVSARAAKISARAARIMARG